MNMSHHSHVQDSRVEDTETQVTSSESFAVVSVTSVIPAQRRRS